jgi:hypothetical protein
MNALLRWRLPQALASGGGVLASTWLFMEGHGDDQKERLSTAFGGLVYGAAYASTSWNLAVPAIAHLTYNALAVLSRDRGPVRMIPPLRHGMIVLVDDDLGLLKRMMQGHGGWDYRMGVLSDRAGQVVGFSETTGDPVVRFPFGSICHFNELALVPLYGACVSPCSHVSSLASKNADGVLPPNPPPRWEGREGVLPARGPCRGHLQALGRAQEGPVLG